MNFLTEASPQDVILPGGGIRLFLAILIIPVLAFLLFAWGMPKFNQDVQASQSRGVSTSLIK